MFFTISLEATQNVTTEFGVLCLGIFVGGILAFSLSKSDGNLKTAIAIIGAALGGAPMLFIEDVGGWELAGMAVGCKVAGRALAAGSFLVGAAVVRADSAGIRLG